MHTVTVKENKQIADFSFILSFQRPFVFVPGQVIDIVRNGIRRIYSIVSGNEEEDVKILYKVNPSGKLTPTLAGLKAGDSIDISSPYGSFTHFFTHAMCIATGTGIAPFASEFFSDRWQEKTLIHGSRTLQEFYFSDSFKRLNDKYIRCCSGEKREDVFYGRVTDYLAKIQPDKKIMYYLCGNAEMVVDVRDLLIDKGISYDHIFAEIYF
ncbi:MAG: oxidoreductase [Bacteroidales bacterium]|nr:oxidoreductase [Bacteroidales bacterium]